MHSVTLPEATIRSNITRSEATTGSHFSEPEMFRQRLGELLVLMEHMLRIVHISAHFLTANSRSCTNAAIMYACAAVIHHVVRKLLWWHPTQRCIVMWDNLYMCTQQSLVNSNCRMMPTLFQLTKVQTNKSEQLLYFVIIYITLLLWSRGCSPSNGVIIRFYCKQFRCHLLLFFFFTEANYQQLF